MANEKATHLSVRALKDGFRRAGRAWSGVETTVPIKEFTDEQVAALEAEPLLTVKRVTVAAEKPAK